MRRKTVQSSALLKFITDKQVLTVTALLAFAIIIGKFAEPESIGLATAGCLKGDANGDKLIDAKDYDIFLEHKPEAFSCCVDLNANGAFDEDDLNLFFNQILLADDSIKAAEAFGTC